MATNMRVAGFEKFETELTKEDVDQCAHTGENDGDVRSVSQHAYITEQLDRIGEAAIRAELKKHGVWSPDDLSNGAENRLRIIWIAAWDILEETD